MYYITTTGGFYTWEQQKQSRQSWITGQHLESSSVPQESEVVKIVFLMELAGLEGRKKLEKYDVASVIRYEGK